LGLNLLLVGSASERKFGSMNVFKTILCVTMSSAAAHRALSPANGYPLVVSCVVFVLILRTRCSSPTNVPLTFLITAGLWVSDEVSRFCFAKDHTFYVIHLTGAAIGSLAGSTSTRAVPTSAPSSPPGRGSRARGPSVPASSCRSY
jgi:hypothetical protein